MRVGRGELCLFESATGVTGGGVVVVELTRRQSERFSMGCLLLNSGLYMFGHQKQVFFEMITFASPPITLSSKTHTSGLVFAEV